jgi:hypothetical protein
MTGESQRRRVMLTHAIRALLLASEDGMTVGELARTLAITNTTVNAILADEYGYYVDRWADTGSTLAAVWMCVQVPSNCPRPDKQTQGASHAALELV